MIFTVQLTHDGYTSEMCVRAENEDHAISRAVTRTWGPLAYLEPGELWDRVLAVTSSRTTRVLCEQVQVRVIDSA